MIVISVKGMSLECKYTVKMCQMVVFFRILCNAKLYLH